ncbi:MAG: hypothetical protein KOO69_03355, partial [Victivallales bacterium]|nr:hypothetical protein [Victivallales bacterium]
LILNFKEKKELDLKLTSREKLKVKVKIPETISINKISDTVIPYLLAVKDKNYKGNLDIRAFAIKKASGKIKIDGDLSDWKNIPFIKIKNRTSQINKLSIGGNKEYIKGKIGYSGDFEAEFKTAWDKDFLYLAVRVHDDKFVHEKYEKNPSQRWHNDSLQIYIDTLGNGKGKLTKRIDDDDYNYDFFAEVKSGTALAYRRSMPNMQLAGGIFAPKSGVFEPKIKTAFKLTKDGYLYEIAIPILVIEPLKLKKGTVFGFGIYLNDRDGKYVKGGLTLTPAGTGCHMNPHLWPSAILTD